MPHTRLLSTMLRRVLITLLMGVCVFGLVPAMAQDVELSAEIDRSVLSLIEMVHLTVKVSVMGNKSVSEPELDYTKSFAILDEPSRQDGYNLVNGKVSRYMERVYALQPIQTGTLVIPAVRVNVGGQEYKTESRTVKVTPIPGSKAGLPSVRDPRTEPSDIDSDADFNKLPPYVITAKLSKKSAYVGEQVILRIDYYATFRLPRSPGQRAPIAQGFVAEELPAPEPEIIVHNNQQYAHYIKNWALFPTTAGKHKIQSAVEEILAAPDYIARKYQSPVVMINVKSLPPAPAGAGFKGAVGNFKVQLTTDKSEVKAGEGLTVKVTVSGTGSVQGITAPQLDAGSQVKIYPSGDRRSTAPQTRGGQAILGGTAEFNYLVVPRTPGTLQIKPVKIMYFNPQTSKFETATSGALSLNALPGEVLPDAKTDGTGALRTQDAMKPRLKSRGWILLHPVCWLLFAGCIISLGWAGYTWFHRHKILANPDAMRASAACITAKRALRMATSGTADQFHERVSGALTRYVSDRFGLGVGALTAEEVERVLLEADVPEDLAAQFSDIIGICEVSKYAPGLGNEGTRQNLLQTAGMLIEKLETALGGLLT